jgi:hypothetical protein
MRYCVSVLACLSVLACGVRVEHEEQELMIATNLSSAGSGTTSLVSGGSSAGATTTTSTATSTGSSTASTTGTSGSSSNETVTDTSGATSKSIVGVWDMTTAKATAQEVVTWMYINPVRIKTFRDEQSFGGDGRNCFSVEVQTPYNYSTDHEHQYNFNGFGGSPHTMYVLANGKLYWSYIDTDLEEAVLNILDPVENVQTSDDIQICN